MEFSLLQLDLDAGLPAGNQCTGCILAKFHALLFERDQAILSGGKPVQQTSTPPRILPIGEGGCQCTAYRPGTIHQQQARVAGVELRNCQVQAASSPERRIQSKLTP